MIEDADMTPSLKQESIDDIQGLKMVMVNFFKFHPFLLIFEICRASLPPNMPSKFGLDWLRHLGGVRPHTDRHTSG